MGRRGERVLIVDEHLASRCVVAEALERRGYTCVAVKTVAEALFQLVQFDPRVVVLEWAFRDGSGCGLARRLRTRKQQLVLVAVSYLDAPPDASEFDEYLVKPVPVEEIERAFRRHTARPHR